MEQDVDLVLRILGRIQTEPDAEMWRTVAPPPPPAAQILRAIGFTRAPSPYGGDRLVLPDDVNVRPAFELLHTLRKRPAMADHLLGWACCREAFTYRDRGEAELREAWEDA